MDEGVTASQPPRLLESRLHQIGGAGQLGRGSDGERRIHPTAGTTSRSILGSMYNTFVSITNCEIMTKFANIPHKSSGGGLKCQLAEQIKDGHWEKSRRISMETQKSEITGDVLK